MTWVWNWSEPPLRSTTRAASFTTATAIGAQSVVLASAVDRYLAVKWAWVGAGTGPSATFAVYVARD